MSPHADAHVIESVGLAVDADPCFVPDPADASMLTCHEHGEIIVIVVQPHDSAPLAIRTVDEMQDTLEIFDRGSEQNLHVVVAPLAPFAVFEVREGSADGPPGYHSVSGHAFVEAGYIMVHVWRADPFDTAARERADLLIASVTETEIEIETEIETGLRSPDATSALPFDLAVSEPGWEATAAGPGVVFRHPNYSDAIVTVAALSNDGFSHPTLPRLVEQSIERGGGDIDPSTAIGEVGDLSARACGRVRGQTADGVHVRLLLIPYDREPVVVIVSVSAPEEHVANELMNAWSGWLDL